MKSALRVVSICLMAVALFVMTGCSAKSGNANQLRVGMECAYAPFNWTQSDDKNGAVPIEGGGFAGGYDVEIAKRLAEGLGRELVIVKTEWDGLEPALQSGTIDAIIAGMSPTADRKARIDFTDNYYISDLVVVVRKDGPFAGAKTLEDFGGAKITGQLNTVHYTVIDQLTGVDKQTAMENFPAMITALATGVIDGYISEQPGAVSAMVSNPELTYIAFEPGAGFVAAEEDIAIAAGLKKGSELREPINQVLAQITQDERNSLMAAALENQPVVAD